MASRDDDVTAGGEAAARTSCPSVPAAVAGAGLLAEHAMSVMTLEHATTVRLPYSFDETLSIAVDALRAEGFTILGETDLQATLQEEAGARIGRYLVLGVCHAVLAQKALAASLDLGTVLPCSVVIYENGGQVVVSAVAPVALLAATRDLRGASEPARETAERLRRAIGAIRK
jgi:uncharacterized protein (DUF302 family)